jgi:hypothetical protein
MNKFSRAAKCVLICGLFAASLFAQQPAVRVYNVTSAATFPSLTVAAGSMIFINGLFASPGRDYVLTTTPTAASVRFLAGSLRDGFQVEIVTLPACSVCPATQ